MAKKPKHPLRRRWESPECIQPDDHFVEFPPHMHDASLIGALGPYLEPVFGAPDSFRRDPVDGSVKVYDFGEGPAFLRVNWSAKNGCELWMQGVWGSVEMVCLLAEFAGELSKSGGAALGAGDVFGRGHESFAHIFPLIRAVMSRVESRILDRESGCGNSPSMKKRL